MDENLNKKIEAQLAELPEAYKKVFSSFDWKGKIQAIAEKYHLLLDQQQVLYAETLITMLGLQTPEDYLFSIRKKMEIDLDEARPIADEVNETILYPLKEAILKSTSTEEVPEGEGEILSSIENPPASKPVSFAETKIREPHGLKEATQGDSDIPTPPEARGVDPYREEV